MKITLLLTGKTTEDYLIKGTGIYEKRLKHYLPFAVKVISDLKNTKNLNETQVKEKEGELILKELEDGDTVFLLDEKGEGFSSVGFSQFIEKKANAGCRHLVFVVGGPYGFSGEVYKRADGKISVSKMTFSHQLVRLVFLEQLYRAMTIIRGEPYHHE